MTSCKKFESLVYEIEDFFEERQFGDALDLIERAKSAIKQDFGPLKHKVHRSRSVDVQSSAQKLN